MKVLVSKPLEFELISSIKKIGDYGVSPQVCLFILQHPHFEAKLFSHKPQKPQLKLFTSEEKLENDTSHRNHLRWK